LISAADAGTAVNAIAAVAIRAVDLKRMSSSPGF
jgi:hypothetical protein